MRYFSKDMLWMIATPVAVAVAVTPVNSNVAIRILSIGSDKGGGKGSGK